MLSTGPLFLSIMWKEYLMSSPPSDARIAIMPEQWFHYTLLWKLIKGIVLMRQSSSLPLAEAPGTGLMPTSSFGYIM
jgi:hypothetical protein